MTATPHLTSQGSVVLTGDGRHLLVTNAASDDVTVFAVGAGGELERVGRTPSGPAPKSVAEHGGLVYVLNTGAGLGDRLPAGRGRARADRRRRASLSAPDADGAQVGFTPDGSTLIVTERGPNSIVSFAVGDGRDPRRRRSWWRRRAPRPTGSPSRRGGTLVVTEAFGAQKGAAAASSYTRRRGDGHPGHEVGRQRPQRDLLGRRHRRRPPRLHHQLRRRRRVPVRDRPPTAA